MTDLTMYCSCCSDPVFEAPTTKEQWAVERLTHHPRCLWVLREGKQETKLIADSYIIIPEGRTQELKLVSKKDPDTVVSFHYEEMWAGNQSIVAFLLAHGFAAREVPVPWPKI